MQRCSAFLIAILLALLSANVAMAETNICDAGIGGTGIQQDGIGGTGVQASSGIGGTGIVGVITGFASICVNGLEVHYDRQTSVDIDGLPATIDELNIGQLVAIESSSKGNRLSAQRVSVSHIIVGKIETIDTAKNTLQMMGQNIHLGPDTITSADLKPNQLVKISGLVTTNNAIQAIRIDVAAANTPFSVVGVIDQAGKINGVNIANANSIPTGRMVQASGRWDGRKFQADHIDESAAQRVLRSAENVVIQGISTASVRQKFSVQNQAINIDANTKISGESSSKNQIIIVRGKLDSAGKITARSIEYSNENKLLERGGNKHRPNASEKTKRERAQRDKDANDKKDSKNRPEHAERPEKTEKSEKVERPEKMERLEHVERPEKIEKPEKIERPERPERHEGLEH